MRIRPRSVVAAVFVVASMVVSSPARSQPMSETGRWFEFAPDPTGAAVAGSVIDMSSWMPAPAGSRGRAQMLGDRLAFPDGSSVKFWGTNLGNMDNAPDKQAGARWAEFHARMGVNAVRLHKFIGPGGGGIGDENDSTKFDAAKLDRFDYFVAECRKRGIYYGFSWVFEHKLRPADKARVAAYDEIMAVDGGNTHRVPVFVDRDVQRLRMDMLSALLKHRNPYTGLTYAEDPALAFVEFHNEDSIFFFTFGQLTRYPGLYARFTREWNEWLKAKYGSSEGLLAAWGQEALDAFDVKGESLEKMNIELRPNPWHGSPEGIKQAEQRGAKQRVADNMMFLHEKQGDFYRRFIESVREAGYQGPKVGSPWTTPAGLPQYLNLHNDAEVGMVDRHTYFGGAEGWRPQPGKFDARAQVDEVGSGLLSQGLLQVGRTPFALSEWSTVFPNEWYSESQVLIAAYGMGLQGWDASFHFASHINEYQGRVWGQRVSDPRLWVTNAPGQIGLWPVLSRMILRGDVKEGPVISTRRVSLEELASGGPEWLGREVTTQTGDLKEFRSALPQAALAAGRVLVEFTEEPEASDWPDLTKLVGADGTVTSATGQLRWTPARDGRRGFVTIDTPGTQGACGFLPGSAMEFTDFTLTPAGGFATVLATAREIDRTLATSASTLIVALARTRNTGQTFSADGTLLTAVGQGPILLEPVTFTLTFKTPGQRVVHVLDHNGVRTGRTLAVTGGGVTIDTGAHRAFYFEVEKR